MLSGAGPGTGAPRCAAPVEGLGLVGAAVSGGADRDFLLARLDGLRGAYAELPPGRPDSVVHGDAWGGSCAVTRDGQVTLLDFERTSLGRPEWGLTSTAVALDTTGTLTTEAYDAFCTAYGDDVRQWPGYPVLQSIRELRMITFAAQAADHDPRAREGLGNATAGRGC